jgi:hypothetical protein
MALLVLRVSQQHSPMLQQVMMQPSMMLQVMMQRQQPAQAWPLCVAQLTLVMHSWLVLRRLLL